MYKAWGPDDWSWGEPTSYLVKVASRGLVGADRLDFVKRAGEGWGDALKLVRAGETPIHLIAMGCHEKYGDNRNGDGFTARWLRQKHATFVTGARFYRDHRNRPGDLHYGRVLKSAFNEDMGRVELLAALYATKEAAAREPNGRVADLEHEKLESGEDMTDSMSCKIAHDVCHACGNEAPARRFYCDDRDRQVGGRKVAACHRGGVLRHMTKVHDDGFINGVDNPNPDFFDISHITRNRQADRTAYVLGALHKAAAEAPDGPFLMGVEKAALYGMTDEPAGDAPAWARRRAKLAAELAALESRPLAAFVLDGAVRPGVHDLPGEKRAAHAVVAASAVNGLLLPLETWLAAAGGDPARAKAAAEAARPYLADAFAGLCAEADPAAFLAEYSPEPRRAISSTRVDGTLAKLAADCRLDVDAATRRAMRRALSGTPAPTAPAAVKSAAAADPALRRLASAYAGYQLAVLESAAGTDAGGAHPAAILLVASNRLV